MKQIVDGKLIRARGVYGFWPANADGDDVVLWTASEPGRPKKIAARFPMLRQQEVIADDKPNRSLADFVAPIDSGITDYVGAFAVTAGIGVDALVKKYEAAHDDYSAIIVKAIADRLAEAFAEYLHAQARKDWGFGDALSNDDLIDEKYPRHPSGVRLPGVPGSQREGPAVRAARRAVAGPGPHRVVRDDAGGVGQRPVLRAPAVEVLRDPAHRPGPGRRLREAQGHERRRRRALAAARAGLRARFLSPPDL